MVNRNDEAHRNRHRNRNGGGGNGGNGGHVNNGRGGNGRGGNSSQNHGSSALSHGGHGHEERPARRDYGRIHRGGRESRGGRNGRGHGSHSRGAAQQAPPRLEMVEDFNIMMTQDADGNVVETRATNNSLGGGRQMEIMSRLSHISNAVAGATSNPQALAEAGSLVQHLSGQKRLGFMILPLTQVRRAPPGSMESMERPAILSATSSLASRAQDPGPDFSRDVREVKDEGENNGQEHARGVPRELCAGCGSDTHHLDLCTKAGRDGFIRGCPECNSINHSVDECRHFARLDLVERVKLLVLNRSRMPAFASSNSWADLFAQYLETNADAAPPPFGFPWSQAFGLASRQWTGQQALALRTFDRLQDRGALPLDRNTETWESVLGLDRSVIMGRGTGNLRHDLSLAQTQARAAAGVAGAAPARGVNYTAAHAQHVRDARMGEGPTVDPMDYQAEDDVCFA